MIKKLIISSMLIGLVGLTTNAETIDSKYYKITDKGVFYLSGVDELLLLPYADPKTFVVLDDYVAKDKQAVYVWGEVLENVDTDTFNVIDAHSNLTKDKNYVYHDDIVFGNQIISSADSDTIELVATIEENRQFPVIKDKNYVFLERRIIENADPKTFQTLNGLYFKDNKAIYYGRQRITDVDLSSFITLNSRYAKDANHIYWDGQPIKGIDTTSIEVIDVISKEKNSYFDPVKQHIYPFFIKDKSKVYNRGKSIDLDVNSFEVLTAQIAKDKNTVYFFNREKVEEIDADAQTFNILSNNIAKDKKHVYKMNENSGKPAIWNIYMDSETFEVISSVYSKDKSRVYFVGKTIVDANPMTFQIISGVYGRDNKYVYLRGEKITGVDIKSFRPINGTFSQDDNRVYYFTKAIEGADSRSFLIINEFFGVDYKNIYAFLFKNKVQAIPNVDIKSFEVFNLKYASRINYAKDKTFVYYQDGLKAGIVKDADPKTFEVLYDCTGKDKNNCYRSSEKYDCNPVEPKSLCGGTGI